MRSVHGLCWLVVLLAVACGGGGANVKVGTMPQGGNFTGVYFSPEYGEMHMVQNGNAVVGKYKKDERSGTIQGEVEGDVMRFEWVEYKAMVSNRPQETRGHGYFRYLIDATNGDHLVDGRWGLGDDNSAGGKWTAYKSRSREPNLEQFEGGKSSGGEDTEESDESEDSSSSDESSESEDDVF